MITTLQRSSATPRTDPAVSRQASGPAALVRAVTGGGGGGGSPGQIQCLAHQSPAPGRAHLSVLDAELCPGIGRGLLKLSDDVRVNAMGKSDQPRVLRGPNTTAERRSRRSGSRRGLGWGKRGGKTRRQSDATPLAQRPAQPSGVVTQDAHERLLGLFRCGAANRQPPPTANCHQPPTAANRPPIATNHHRPPTTYRRQPPSTANCQPLK